MSAAVAPPAVAAELGTVLSARTKALAEGFVEAVYNGGRVELLDELVAADFTGLEPGRPPDRSELRGLVARRRVAFPGLRARSGVWVVRLLAGKQAESWTYWPRAHPEGLCRADQSGYAPRRAFTMPAATVPSRLPSTAV